MEGSNSAQKRHGNRHKLLLSLLLLWFTSQWFFFFFRYERNDVLCMIWADSAGMECLTYGTNHSYSTLYPTLFLNSLFIYIYIYIYFVTVGFKAIGCRMFFIYFYLFLHKELSIISFEITINGHCFFPVFIVEPLDRYPANEIYLLHCLTKHKTIKRAIQADNPMWA